MRLVPTWVLYCSMASFKSDCKIEDSEDALISRVEEIWPDEEELIGSEDIKAGERIVVGAV
jgi:hypothetical protein